MPLLFPLRCDARDGPEAGTEEGHGSDCAWAVPMSARERTGVIATCPPTNEMPITWLGLGLRLRAFNSNREAENLARAFMEQGIAIVAFNGVNSDGDLCVHYLLPQSAESEQTTAILNPYAAERLGGWNEVIAIN
jgi:hypothetical protein